MIFHISKILPGILMMTFILSACNNSNNSGENENISLSYEMLEKELENAEKYEELKNNQISDLRNQLYKSRDEAQRLSLTLSLINQYEAYNADSSLYYLNKALAMPLISKDQDKRLSLLIKRADIYGHAGLFSDALDAMEQIPRDSLTESLLEDYYSTYCSIYQYLTEYTNHYSTTTRYEDLRTLYTDSLKSVTSPGSFNNLVCVQAEEARVGDAAKVTDTLKKALAGYRVGSREYSILTSILAYIYKTTGNRDQYKYYLAQSAISDVKGAIKENVSFREIATMMFEEGDVEGANKYLKKSISDANFYSALMRNAQSAKILPIIDDAYTNVQHQLTSRLRTMVWISCSLALILVVALIFILMQFSRLRKEHDRINTLNNELHKLSDELRDSNENLTTNNLIKEKYAGLFMEYCATAISTLDHYQKSLRLAASQPSNRSSLMKKLESTETADSLRKNFYEKFDDAILSIYPSFVEKFNTLLPEPNRIIPKTGELLNTELRIFALIRLGIDDSSHIAQFLQCSLSTIYTYRSKIKKKAFDPDSFEDEVKKIQ